jgi:CRP-like cAMP-binding protein
MLRRFPFFGFMSDDQLRTVAMLSEETHADAGRTLFEEGADADSFYLLVDGAIDHFYVVEDELNPRLHKELLVGHVDPGEIFGISALIPPHRFTTTARVTRPSHMIQMNARALRARCEEDSRLAVGLMTEAARAAILRLGATRVQLAAASH